MAENSKIEWTHHTFNSWRGCTKISPGCANCYAEQLSGRNPSTLGVWGPNGKRVVAAEAAWKEPLKWNRKAQEAGERHRVFCASLADVFEDWHKPMVNHHGQILNWEYQPATTDELNADEFLSMNCVRSRLFELIDATPYLDWLLVTKRPENIRRMWFQPLNGHDYGSGQQIQRNRDLRRVTGQNSVRRVDKDGMRPNVWLLTSVESQEQADKRIPELLKCRDLAPVLGLSMEPLLGPVCLQPRIVDGQFENHQGINLDWIIVGGESGHGARPMRTTWVSDIIAQCESAGAPVFVKQLGANAEEGYGCHRKLKLNDKKGGDWSEWPTDLKRREFPEVSKCQH